MDEALSYAAKLYHFRADALILQDLGFAELIKKNLLGLPIHLSTPGTIYNIEGVHQAKALGFSRVVLARELTLEEVSAITSENLVEIVVFSHGALYICYSGQCQMSSEIGGRSGNRGACAQPCRLPYVLCKEKNGQLKEITKPTFALSPKDLCTIEHIDQLSQAGIASLKIEGRMKSSEYVAIVTKIYRKYLDVYAETGNIKVEKGDLKELCQIFNRGDFTEGYLFGNPEERLMSGDLSKHQGIYIGRVTGYTAPRKTDGRQRGLVDIKLEKDVSIGDGVEIRNKELPGNIITYIKKKDQNIQEAQMDADISIPLSKLNELRRMALEELETKRKWKRPNVSVLSLNHSNGLAESDLKISEESNFKAGSNKEYTCHYYFRADTRCINDMADRIYLPYDAMLEGNLDIPRAVPVIPSVTKGWHDKQIHENFSRIVGLAMRNGISVGNLGWIEPFASKGVGVIGDFGLNLYNSMDFYLARELGIREAVISQEAAIEDILEMDFHGVIPEITVDGKIPLMISEHDFYGDKNEEKDGYFLKDRKGEFYPIFAHPGSRQNTIFSYKNQEIKVQKNLLIAKGIRRFRCYIL